MASLVCAFQLQVVWVSIRQRPPAFTGCNASGGCSTVYDEIPYNMYGQ